MADINARGVDVPFPEFVKSIKNLCDRMRASVMYDSGNNTP